MSLLRTRVAALAAAGAVVVALSACTSGPEPDPSTEPRPSESAAPIFASDDEALAAAVEAYEKYLAVVDQLTGAGGENAQRIREVAAEDYAAELEASLERLRASGTRTSGASTADHFKLVQYRDEAGVGAEVSIYVCLDASGVRVMDASGADVTPADRVDRRPLQVKLISATDNPATLLPTGSETWPGDDFC
ncbi:hypothetical protein ACFVTX_11995 [Agromyces sp. NPDC058136]|uniref:hypothetical protein n=1 Tax=Agromyces sp. NPDC058136 TaxID=3346354 RepID=UPI0036DD9E5B